MTSVEQGTNKSGIMLDVYIFCILANLLTPDSWVKGMDDAEYPAAKAVDGIAYSTAASDCYLATGSVGIYWYAHLGDAYFVTDITILNKYH